VRIAVLSLCRDRLAYTKHCFQTLRDLAGCDYDHYVLDQGSQDGTVDWLETEQESGGITDYYVVAENIGVSRGINRLLDWIHPENYDVIVKYDNDCELLVDGTLRVCAEIAAPGYWMMSPHIMGLNSPPVVEREELMTTALFRKQPAYRIGIPNIMGGIFMAAPASLYETYRHDESNPIWGLDDAKIVDYWRAQGGEVGYLLDYPARHFLTTAGQEQDDVGGYYTRKIAEYHT
jgi:hypothetical protein